MSGPAGQSARIAAAASASSGRRPGEDPILVVFEQRCIAARGSPPWRQPPSSAAGQSSRARSTPAPRIDPAEMERRGAWRSACFGVSARAVAGDEAHPTAIHFRPRGAYRLSSWRARDCAPHAVASTRRSSRRAPGSGLRGLRRFIRRASSTSTSGETGRASRSASRRSSILSQSEASTPSDQIVVLTIRDVEPIVRAPYSSREHAQRRVLRGVPAACDRTALPSILPMTSPRSSNRRQRTPRDGGPVVAP